MRRASLAAIGRATIAHAAIEHATIARATAHATNTSATNGRATVPNATIGRATPSRAGAAIDRFVTVRATMARWAARAFCVVAAAGPAAGCSASHAGASWGRARSHREAPEAPALEPPRLPEWRRAKRRLAELRARAAGTGPRTMRVALRLREPVTGRVLEARGAVAVRPPDALRMILLGPGGTTALDLWARGDRYRVEVPAAGVLRRGDARTPRRELRGLPVDFLRWWLLRPASGTLLWARTDPAGGGRFVLRDGPAIVDVRTAPGGGIAARRTTWAHEAGSRVRTDEETVVAGGLGCAPASYRQASIGIEVEVRCEGVEEDHAPDPRAFEDPDAIAEREGAEP